MMVQKKLWESGTWGGTEELQRGSKERNERGCKIL